MIRDADWAFAAYEAARRRLPEAAFPATSVAIPDIGAVADRFDAFLLDAYGVLNVGDTALPNAVARVAELQKAGKRALVLTNGATYPARDALAKYRRWGFDLAPEDVVSSRDALAALLPGEVALLGDDPGVYRAAGGFILLSAGEWTDARQDLLAAALAERMRPVLVGNPDIVSPNERGFALEPGHYAHDLAERVGAAPVFFGKPFGAVFEIALARLSPGARVAMVGDTLHTDVLGGRAAGVATILVASHGLFARRDVAPYVARSGIVPDYVAEIT